MMIVYSQRKGNRDRQVKREARLESRKVKERFNLGNEMFIYLMFFINMCKTLRVGRGCRRGTFSKRAAKIECLKTRLMPWKSDERQPLLTSNSPALTHSPDQFNVVAWRPRAFRTMESFETYESRSARGHWPAIEGRQQVNILRRWARSSLCH